MEIKTKILSEEARLPTRGTEYSVGYDLYSIEDVDLSEHYIDDKPYLVRTGIAMEIPENHAGFVMPRSSHGFKHITQTNGVGLIDPDYRGEIKVPLKATDIMDVTMHITKGERIGQLVVVPCEELDFVAVSELTHSDRGTKGFGSTGF